ncbi:MAG: FHA domain-containing protein [Verrucomicrobiales bacterium]|nr:FHA domain-containing protein [Verrucomicrobiota bacterium JB025]
MPRVTITVPEKNAQPYRFKLEREVVTLGRGSDNDIAIDCGSVSVRHAEMRRLKGGYELVDLGSTNGMKYGSERRDRVKLRDGITVTLGDVAFDFSLSEEEQKALKAEAADGGAHNPMSADDLPPMSADDLPPVRREFTAESSEDEEPAATSNAGLVVLALILAVASAFAGMAIRFQQDTGDSLVDAIRNKGVTQSAPAEKADAE